MNRIVFLCFAVSLCGLFPALAKEEAAVSISDARIAAQQAEENGKYKVAAKAYRKLAKDVTERNVRAELYHREAFCWQRAKKSQKAFDRYKELLQQYPLYISYDEVVPQLRQLAQAFLDGNGTFLGLRDRDGAIEIYKLIILDTPTNKESPADRTKLAKLLVDAGREEEAVNTYAELLKQYPENDDSRLEMAQLLMELSRKSDGDGSRLRAAERHAKIILERNPEYKKREEAEALIEDAREREAQRLLNMAMFYLKRSHYRPEAARRYANELILQFQGSAAAWEAKRLLDEHPALKERKDK